MLPRPSHLRGKGSQIGGVGRVQHQDRRRRATLLRALQGVETDVCHDPHILETFCLCFYASPCQVNIIRMQMG